MLIINIYCISYTTTDLTPEEIYDLGMSELDRIHAEMRTAFDELGYPSDHSLESLYSQVAAESGFLTGAEILPGYEAIISDAEVKLPTAFATLPQQEVIVKPDVNGGFYIPGSVDGSRPGAVRGNDRSGAKIFHAEPDLSSVSTRTSPPNCARSGVGPAHIPPGGDQHGVCGGLGALCGTTGVRTGLVRGRSAGEPRPPAE